MKKETTNAPAVFAGVAEVKAYIKKKFRNVARFSKIAGIPHPDVIHNLYKKGPCPDLQAIYQTAQKLENQTLDGEVTEADKITLYTFINQNFNGNVAEFVRKKGVDYPTTYKILNRAVTAKTELVQSVLNACKAE